MNLLLIEKSLNIIQKYTLNNTDCILFTQGQSYDNLFSLINNKNYDNIGIFSHGNHIYFEFTELVFTDENKEFISFLKQLKERTHFKNLDLFSCYFGVNSNFVSYIETQVEINVRASIDNTGNKPFGNWIMETDNINVKKIYFKDDISNFKQTLLIHLNNRSNIVVNYYKNGKNIIYSNDNAFAVLNSEGSVTTMISSKQTSSESTPSNSSFGGVSSNDKLSPFGSTLTENVVKIYSTSRAFAALKSDGSVVTWGNEIYNGELKNVDKIYSTNYAFAALKKDDSVVTWGLTSHGGDSSDVLAILTNVDKIYSTNDAFAALKRDGSVVTWGNISSGGDSSNNNLSPSGSTLTNVVKIYSTGYAFAALKRDGSVVTWGVNEWGGDSSNNNLSPSGSTLTNVVKIYSTGYAFAALKRDGSVVTWSVHAFNDYYIVPVLKNVVKIYSTILAFAALKSDGSVVTWGHKDYGADSSLVEDKLKQGVVKIYSTETTFAALKSDGITELVMWGNNFSPTALVTINKNIQDAEAAENISLLRVYSNVKEFIVILNDRLYQLENKTEGGLKYLDISFEKTDVYDTTHLKDDQLNDPSILIDYPDYAHIGPWEQLGQNIEGRTTEDWFGHFVSLSDDGSIVAIGAPKYNVNTGCVGVYKYTVDENGSSWKQLGEYIDGEATQDNSGNTISLSGNGSIVAIGAHFNGSSIGHVRVYEYRIPTSNEWNDQYIIIADGLTTRSVNYSDDKKYWVLLGQDIVGERSVDYSGYSVSLSKDGYIVAIGAHYNDDNADNLNDNRGHVRVYKYNLIANKWDKLGEDIDGEAKYDQSGNSVSLSNSGDIVAITATKNDSNNNDNSGHVRVYEYRILTNEELNINNSIIIADDSSGTRVSDKKYWVLLGEDIDGKAANDESGISVSLNGNGHTVAIGSSNVDKSGLVRVYQYDSDNNEWSQLGNDIIGEATNDFSGHCVSLSNDGSIVAISGPGNGEDSGHVRVYKYINSSWVKLGIDIDGQDAGDLSGYSISLSKEGDKLAIGAIRRTVDNNVVESGYVRIYKLDGVSGIGSDFDGDGVLNNADAFPNDPNETADADGDGVGDNADAFPNDPNNTTNSKGSGDPYITTLCGNKFKLPDVTKIYRMVEFTDSKNIDLIINASVSPLTDDEINLLKNTALLFTNLSPVTDGYFYDSFYISYGSNYAVFDRNINLIETNIIGNDIEDKNITIDFITEKKEFKCPIQGNSTSIDTVIKVANSVITLQRINHPQIINGIEFCTLDRNISMVKGILNTYYHPNNYCIEKLDSVKRINEVKNKKIYNKTIVEEWIDV